VRTKAGERAAKEQREKKVKKTQEPWEKRLWHVSHQGFSCEKNAQQAWTQARKGKPSVLAASFP
jgi:hypothetical protein